MRLSDLNTSRPNKHIVYLQQISFCKVLTWTSAWSECQCQWIKKEAEKHLQKLLPRYQSPYYVQTQQGLVVHRKTDVQDTAQDTGEPSPDMKHSLAQHSCHFSFHCTSQSKASSKEKLSQENNQISYLIQGLYCKVTWYLVLPCPRYTEPCLLVFFLTSSWKLKLKNRIKINK